MQIKSFFIIVFFMLVLATLVFGSMSTDDLTPNTPPAAAQPSLFDQTVPITNVVYSAQSGYCAQVYTVQSGDTLSAIARACGIPLNSLIAANPAIGNPHLIWPGQVIAVPVTGAAAAPVAPLVQPTAAAPAAAPVIVPTAVPFGLVPGGSVSVTIQSMPPNTNVTIAIGKAGTIPFHVDTGVTDAQGRLSVTVAIPLRAKRGEEWQVTVMTEVKPVREYTSPVFIIQ